ncbi:MAG: hypothetical protein ACYTE2_00235 [Planctomycetota bacterium]|jgi:hypothetical protein
MIRDRFIQLVAAIVAVVGFVGAGLLLPRAVAESEKADLRYTDIAIEGAPPIVALGTAIGALRGVIVDYLWIRLSLMKDKGLFYELMADAELITKLAPRFPQVWAFHGHNMAYNVSVMTNTPEERWNWVRSGIDLVRNEGLKYNPNDMVLHRELAFWFGHKLDGNADDAHLHYKREFAREWHLLLGLPPIGHTERIAWIKTLADAPRTLEDADRVTPGTRGLYDELVEASGESGPPGVSFDKRLLLAYGEWEAVKSSPYARLLGLESQLRANSPVFLAVDSIFADPERKPQVDTLIAYLRRTVLADEYNMDVERMLRYTTELGPLDWRHPQAHALYWSRKGTEMGERRVDDPDDIYKIVNNDRAQIHAMQSMARSGLMSVDPFSGDNPGRISDPRWIKVIDRYFRELYDKHYETRGAGGDTFTDFHENFMTSAVRELYRAGDIEGAQEILDELDRLYGRGGTVPNTKYARDLKTFVDETTVGEYEMQPEVARSDVYAALQRGFREGLLLNRPKILEDARVFARDLIDYFKNSNYFNLVNKFGEKRMGDLIGDLEDSERVVLQRVLLDSALPLIDRLTIYNRAGEEFQRIVFDDVRMPLEGEFLSTPMSRTLTLEQVLPEPPGMEAYRAQRAADVERRRREQEAGAVEMESS